MLFVDFSSAFNTIQPHLLMQKLNAMKVNPYVILWLNEFLTNRLQYVKVQGTKSDIIATNTGAPQGCVLSPILFTLYTSECRCNSNTTQLFKYADDTALVCRCVNDDIVYRQEVTTFVTWCAVNYLELNVKKTKEMIVDFRKLPVEHAPLYINNDIVECVQQYKYLGTIIDNKFSFNLNADHVFKKGMSRMYFVRQLRKLRIDSKIMDLFYSSIVQSVLSFSIVCWFGTCSAQAKVKLNRIVSNCERLGVSNITPLMDIYKKCVIQRSKVIYNDKLHPLNSHYEYLPSGRRLRSITTRTSRYLKSFVPSSVAIINQSNVQLQYNYPDN